MGKDRARCHQHQVEGRGRGFKQRPEQLTTGVWGPLQALTITRMTTTPRHLVPQVRTRPPPARTSRARRPTSVQSPLGLEAGNPNRTGVATRVRPAVAPTAVADAPRLPGRLPARDNKNPGCEWLGVKVPSRTIDCATSLPGEAHTHDPQQYHPPPPCSVDFLRSIWSLVKSPPSDHTGNGVPRRRSGNTPRTVE